MSTALYAGSNRFLTTETDRITRHSFSFGEHYDPANLGFGPMICHNDDSLAPGGGYPDHPHADLEIVTWVLDGVLLHTDDAGNTEELRPGDIQVMSAGQASGTPRSPTRRAVRPASCRPGSSPTSPVRRRAGARSTIAPTHGLTTVVGAGGLAIGTEGATLSIARLQPGSSVELPDAARLHAFVAVGGGRDRTTSKQARATPYD